MSNMPNKIIIHIKTLNNRKLSFEVDDNSTVNDLKENIEAKEGIPPSQQKIIFSGRPLLDNTFLRDNKITNDCVVHMVLSLSGG